MGNGEIEIFFLCLLHYNDTCKVNQQFTGGERKVVKMNILNMENFLDTVNACIGKIYMLCPNGKKQNIKGEEKIQDSLWRQYFQNKNCLCLILEIPNPTDYMNIVSYYAGDCWFVCKYFIIKGLGILFSSPALLKGVKNGVEH